MEATAKRTCNITEDEQNRRLRMGVVFFTVTLVAAVVLLKLDVAAGWRALLFVPFFVAANGLFMGLFKA
jgi:hypothetical protein